MGQTHRKNRITKSEGDKIIIPEDILSEIESLPHKKNNKNVVFSEWEDELLIKYGEEKSLTQIASILKKTPTTVMRRRRMLMKGILE